jgi:hypothetical protein
MDAGSLSKSHGYFVTRLYGRLYLTHRIVALLNDLDIEDGTIDHIDRNKLNNKIANLRLVNFNTNLLNKSDYSNNRTGITGVSWRNNNQVWVVQYQCNGKRLSKYFNPKKFNNSKTEAFNAAIKFRQEMEELHYSFLVKKQNVCKHLLLTQNNPLSTWRLRLR